MDSRVVSPSAKKLRDAYAVKKDAPVFMKEFGYYSLDRWIAEGHIECAADLDAICGFDGPGSHYLGNMGGCEAPFMPAFKERILEDRGEHELVMDPAGRTVMYFKGRRNGFMPEYVSHPVKDRRTWEENCKWRMDPRAEGRLAGINEALDNAAPAAAKGLIMTQYVVGGYMYLRSLMGPLELPLMLYDDPALVHECMEAWLGVAEFVTAKHQERVAIDEILIDEDICYKTGSLISPDMVEEFLLPYYRRLIEGVKGRQPGKERLHVQVATDGYCPPVIPLYESVGMDVMSPFEAAANNDVIEIGRKYPNLVISGGMDKRTLAAGKGAIDEMVGRIMPVMRKRGGYIPTCDHGVPEEVDFGDYVHFRKRLSEYA